MPECGTPAMVCESEVLDVSARDSSEYEALPGSPPAYTWYGGKRPFIRPAGDDDDPLPTLYRKTELVIVSPATGSGSGYTITCAPTVATLTANNGFVRTNTLSDSITRAQLLSELDVKLAAPAVWTTNLSLDCVAAFVDGWPSIGFYNYGTCFTSYWDNQYTGTFVATHRKTRVRYRFRIPDSHDGDYYKITWDVADFPTDDAVDPSYVSEDNTVEWIGPGVGAADDPSWLTTWNEIDPPTEPGERRVVNVRFICYHGTKYGSKPQVTGESFEPPAP